jgi:hypothetical protein
VLTRAYTGEALLHPSCSAVTIAKSKSRAEGCGNRTEFLQRRRDSTATASWGARPSPGNGRRALIRNCAFLVNRDPLQRSSNLFLVLAALSLAPPLPTPIVLLSSQNVAACSIVVAVCIYASIYTRCFASLFPALSCATPCTNNMAEVLSRSRDDQSQSYYIQSASNSSSLKRSQSSRTSLLVGSPPKSSHRTASEPSFEHVGSLKRSLASSGSLAASRQSYSDFSQPQTSAPVFSNHQPKLSFELGHHNDTGLAFPAYDEVQFYHEDEPLDLPPSPRPEDETSDADSNDCRRDRDDEDDGGSTTDTTRSDSPLPTPTVADDTAIKHEPSRHVDYLSHDWREEDIWSSWRHIVSQRKVYGQRSRLENASWRTWAKSKYHLPTVSPEALNWYACAISGRCSTLD